MITVIGKMKDTIKYAGREGYNVMSFSYYWSPELNKRFIDEAIERGDQFLIVSLVVTGEYKNEIRYLLERLNGLADQPSQNRPQVNCDAEARGVRE